MTKESDLESIRESILKDGIEFVAIINPQGRVEDFISDGNVDFPGYKQEMYWMGVRLHESMQRDFDDDFGPVRFTISERRDLKFVTVPAASKLVVGIMKKNADHCWFVDQIVSLMNAENKLVKKRFKGGAKIEHI